MRPPRHGPHMGVGGAGSQSSQRHPTNPATCLVRTSPGGTPIRNEPGDWAFSHRGGQITPRMGSSRPPCGPSEQARPCAIPHSPQPCAMRTNPGTPALRGRYDPRPTGARMNPTVCPFRTTQPTPNGRTPAVACSERGGRPDARLVSTPTAGPHASFQTNPAARRSPTLASGPSEQTRPRPAERAQPWYAVRLRTARRCQVRASERTATAGVRPNEPGRARCQRTRRRWPLTAWPRRPTLEAF